MPGGSGDAVFVSFVEHVVRPLARAYEPSLVLVSAGYDAHADDPLAGCVVTDDGYRAMSASVRAMADELGVPLGIVLEGGYDLGALARSVVITLETVGARACAPEVARSSRAAPARARAGARAPGGGRLAGARLRRSAEGGDTVERAARPAERAGAASGLKAARRAGLARGAPLADDFGGVKASACRLRRRPRS